MSCGFLSREIQRLPSLGSLKYESLTNNRAKFAGQTHSEAPHENPRRHVPSDTKSDVRPRAVPSRRREPGKCVQDREG
jgi:hypothetical protein